MRPLIFEPFTVTSQKARASSDLGTFHSPGVVRLGSISDVLQLKENEKTGMSEAERKLEALTQQIEEEMEKKEQEGEYYGECVCVCFSLFINV
ncbi:hypothetical protein E2C01_078510 [Portunus trituberculatus]|uniref:Uncharacterized protein n=1 Tax=Portunus trituberculatus TaxID=210409 RepID=A0A5B7IUB3_PORTR|nr:hypothetical protein [Portunus trituberculatus]